MGVSSFVGTTEKRRVPQIVSDRLPVVSFPDPDFHREQIRYYSREIVRTRAEIARIREYGSAAVWTPPRLSPSYRLGILASMVHRYKVKRDEHVQSLLRATGGGYQA